LCLFLLYGYVPIVDILSFPTRRSSDLTIAKMLFFEANPMNLDDKIPLPIINRLPSGITKFIRIFRLCNKLFLKKYFSKKEEVLRSEEHTSELQSRFDIVCCLMLEKKNK